MSADVTAEQRRQMIAETAYFRAQRRSFAQGDPVADWLAAEAEVDAMLAARRSKRSADQEFEALLARAREAQLELVAEGLRLRLDTGQALASPGSTPDAFTWDELRTLLESVSPDGKRP